MRKLLLLVVFVLVAAACNDTTVSFEGTAVVESECTTTDGVEVCTYTISAQGGETVLVPTVTPTPDPGRPADLPTDDTVLSGIPAEPGVFEANTRDTGRVPNDSAGGNFRTFCDWSHFDTVDPIVFPGVSPAGHLHSFFGNTAVSADSTYESLRTTGDSTCAGGPLNRSGYWTPAVVTPDGPRAPDRIQVYYKTPANVESRGILAELPPGLRFVGGFPDKNQWGGDPWFFTCRGARGEFDRGAALSGCDTAAGDESIDLWVTMPACWDGQRLWSEGSEHMSYYNRDGTCPATHPHILPTITVIQRWNLVTENTFEWRLSSDTDVAGMTAHADWMNGWDPATLSVWHENCLVQTRDCSGSSLGEGTQLVS